MLSLPFTYSAELQSHEAEEELWDTPLANALFHGDSDELQSLKRFVVGAINPFGQELDMFIDRDKDILQQAARKYKKTLFYITRPLNISFQDEPGLDAGGLTREFFHLLMHRLQTPTGSFDLFEGTSGHLVPINSYDFLSGGLFLLVGKMILHSVINNCSGMPGLSPAVVPYIINGCRDACIEHIVLEDFPDPVYHDKLSKVQFKTSRFCL